MFKNILHSASDLGILPIAGLLIFVAVFLATTIRAIRMDKKEAERLARLPLDDSRTDSARGDDQA